MSKYSCPINFFLTFHVTVLQQIAVNLLPLDTLYGVAHLLALDEPNLIDECFQKLGHSEVCLQLALYTFALHVCSLANLVESRKLYTCSQSFVIRNAIRYAQSKSKTEQSDKKLTRYCKLLLQYEHRRADYLQGKLLQSLEKGIDVQKFSEDDNYKQETVLSLMK